MHVPEGSSDRYSASINPVAVCKGSKDIRLNLSDGKGLSDFLLGAEIRRTVILSGVDEVGRKVNAKVSF